MFDWLFKDVCDDIIALKFNDLLRTVLLVYDAR